MEVTVQVRVRRPRTTALCLIWLGVPLMLIINIFLNSLSDYTECKSTLKLAKRLRSRLVLRHP